MKIIQTLPVIAYGDAVGNDTRAIRDIPAARPVAYRISHRCGR